MTFPSISVKIIASASVHVRLEADGGRGRGLLTVGALTVSVHPPKSLSAKNKHFKHTSFTMTAVKRILDPVTALLSDSFF